MNPEHVKSFVTYYLQNLSERTRREKAGTKWGIDWIAYNIGLARFGNANVDYYRCDPCGHVWTDDETNPNSQPHDITVPNTA